MVESITQILTGIMDFLHSYTGSYGWAIIIFGVLIKIVLYPFTHSQYKSMKEMQKKMQKIQPAIKKLQEKYKNDPQRMQTEQMALFKKHNVNPLGGCVPLLIQLPILWGIFNAISSLASQGKFSHETFLWIGGPLSGKYPDWFATSLADNDIPLLLVYGFSMFLSQKMTMSSDISMDDSQKFMNMFMPVILTFVLWKFPSALILYWLVFNILSVIQQKSINTGDSSIPLTDPEPQEDENTDIEPKKSPSRSRKNKGGKL